MTRSELDGYRMDAQAFLAEKEDARKVLASVVVTSNNDHTRATVVTTDGLPLLGYAPGEGPTSTFDAVKNALGHTQPVLQGIFAETGENGLELETPDGLVWELPGSDTAAIQTGVEAVLLENSRR